MYSPRDYVRDGLDTLLAFRRILDCRLPFWDDLNEVSHCLSVFLPVAEEFALSKAFSRCQGKKYLKYGSIHKYSICTYSLSFSNKRKRLNRSFEGLYMFLLLGIGMIDNLGRFKDNVGTVIWLFSG